MLARSFELILDEEPECMHNIIINFDSNWSYASYIISYIDIALVCIGYISSIATRNWIPCILFISCLYALVIISNGCATYFYVMTYLNNWWYNDLCINEADVGYI